MRKSRLRCAICEEQFDGIYRVAASDYEHLVCRQCDERAVTEDGSEPQFGNEYAGRDTVVENSEGKKVIQMAPDVGDNPVFIDGEKCWRLYEFGGFVTLWDPYDCDSFREFHQKQLG
jgi:hypothetical protein